VSLEAAALQVTFGAAPTAVIRSDDVFVATIAVGHALSATRSDAASSSRSSGDPAEGVLAADLRAHQPMIATRTVVLSSYRSRDGVRTERVALR
jgi:hypothetical protein